jgi:hypothetical protein
MRRLLKFLRRSVVDLCGITGKEFCLRDGLACTDRQDEIILSRRDACIPGARQRFWDEFVSVCEERIIYLTKVALRVSNGD